MLAARKESAERSLRPATSQELTDLIGKLFHDDPMHPWFTSFTEFVQSHETESAYRGETSDGFGFVFYPQSGRGMWYRYDTRLSGVGIIGEKGIKSLTSLVK